jgi:hypothetical protein
MSLPAVRVSRQPAGQRVTKLLRMKQPNKMVVRFVDFIGKNVFSVLDTTFNTNPFSHKNADNFWRMDTAMLKTV